MMLLFFIAKMMACSALFYGYYYLFLRNKRFHRYNRFYLISIAAFSFILPFIRIPLTAASHNNNQLYQMLQVISTDYQEAGSAAGTTASQFSHLLSLQAFGWLIYIMVALFLTLALIRSLFYIRTIGRRYSWQQWKGIRLFNTTEKGTPFSFMNSIYWNEQIGMDSAEGQQMLRHEMFHVKQRHTLDILFMEIVCIAAWCNPVFHIIKREMKAIHEFLADQYAVSGHDECEYAELLVMQSIASRHRAITHSFFNNHIKRRITMLTNFSNTRYGYASRVMVLPLAACLFCAVTLYASPFQDRSFTLSEKTFTVTVDAGHGGIDAGAHAENGVLEKDVNLSISNKIKELAPYYNINVVLTRENDALPGNENSVSESLKERLAIAKRSGADLIVSIHANAAGKSFTNRTGFKVYVPENNKDSAVLVKSRIAGSAILSAVKDIYAVSGELKVNQVPSVYIFKEAPCPVVLIECGFINNPVDLKFMMDNKNQEKIARKILEGIAEYAVLVSTDNKAMEAKEPE